MTHRIVLQAVWVTETTVTDLIYNHGNKSKFGRPISFPLLRNSNDDSTGFACKQLTSDEDGISVLQEVCGAVDALPAGDLLVTLTVHSLVVEEKGQNTSHLHIVSVAGCETQSKA